MREGQHVGETKSAHGIARPYAESWIGCEHRSFRAIKEELARRIAERVWAPVVTLDIPGARS